MSFLLSDHQIKRLAKKAKQSLAVADTVAGQIPVELGTPVAEDMAESAIEHAAEALAILTRIKIQLRVRRSIDAHKGGAK